jgi:uncharacterized protein YcbX
MRTIGRIESLWRYPVKSMRGEALEQVFLGFSGVYGDRLYAFRSAKAPKGFPYHTAREQEELLLFTPRFRDGEAASIPTNLVEAEDMSPGMTPVFASLAALAVDVATPDGAIFAIDDPGLIAELRRRLGESIEVSLVASPRPLTDCRPISLFSLQTLSGLTEETGHEIDKRRFRANLYANFDGFKPFAEKELLGQRVKVGDKAELMLLGNDPRCKMITLDPDTAEADPAILRQVTKVHDGTAGLYAAVLVEGVVHPGDPITVVA